MNKIWIIFERRETPTSKSEYWSTQVKGPYTKQTLSGLPEKAIEDYGSLREAQKDGDVRKIRIVQEI